MKVRLAQIQFINAETGKVLHGFPLQSEWRPQAEAEELIKRKEKVWNDLFAEEGIPWRAKVHAEID